MHFDIGVRLSTHLISKPNSRRSMNFCGLQNYKRGSFKVGLHIANHFNSLIAFSFLKMYFKKAVKRRLMVKGQLQLISSLVSFPLVLCNMLCTSAAF